MSKSRYKIDPLNMTDKESRILGSLLVYLNLEQNIYYFPEGAFIYDLDDDGEEVAVELDLKYPILARWSEHNANELRFEVIGERLGKGGFAGVFNVLQTLIPQTDGSLAKKYVPRIVKEQDHISYKSTNGQIISDHEYTQGSLTQHLHLKHPVEDEIDEKMKDFLVGRRMPGVDLKKYLSLHTNSPQFSIENRLRLVVALVRALREQVHERGLVHRDVKADNIIVSMLSGGMPEVNFVDYGISKSIGKVESGSFCGTRKYMAPEAWLKKNVTVESDIYSLGVVLSRVFNASLPKEPMYETSVNRLFVGIFNYVAGLSPEQKIRIRKTLHGMCADEVAERISLEQVEADFEQLRFEITQSGINKRLHAEHAAAHIAALRLRKEMRDYYLLDPDGWDVNVVRCEIESSLLGVRDDERLMREFVATLGVRALDGLQDKASINDQLRKITADFVFARDDVRVALKALNKIMINGDVANFDLGYIEYLEKLAQKCERRNQLKPGSLDDAVTLTNKFTKDMARLKMEIDLIHRFKNTSPPVLVRPSPTARVMRDLPRLFSARQQPTPQFALNPRSAFTIYQKN